jgi:hypothetical protein
MQRNKKLNEMRNGLGRSQVGPDLHCLEWRGWCVVRELKLTMIGTRKFEIKSNTRILFQRLNSNHMLSITKVQTNVHNS